jgi:hypothetical protein
MPSPENKDTSTESAQIDPVTSAIVDAYYPWVLSLPDTARSRAQAAYGVASAIAAVLVALGIFGKLGERPLAVQALGLLALCAWLSTALLFMRAVSASVEKTEVTEYRDANAFAAAVVNASQRERMNIDNRLKPALGAAVAAAVITVIALGAIVRVPATVQSVAATVNLSKAGQQRVAAICGRPLRTVQGRLREASLRERFITITVDPAGCQGQRVRLHLRAEDVVGVAVDVTHR